MEKVFRGGYEIFIFRETKNSTGQALISLAVLWEKAKPDMTPRSPLRNYYAIIFVCSTRICCGATLRGQELCIAPKEADWESQHTQAMGNHQGMSLTRLE